MQETLKKLTAHVRNTKGSGEALRFYVNFIQPIKEYFGGESEVEKLNLQNVTNSTDNEVPEVTKENDFFADLDEYEKQFYCNECGEDKNFKYDRNVSNGEIWNCANCNAKMILNKKPNEDDY